MNHYFSVLKKYATFTGRAHRAEYWMFFLFNFIIAVVLSAVDALVGSPLILISIYLLAVLIPSIAVGIRRMHDTSRSGWWLLIVLVPLVGGIWFFVLTVLDSTPGDNQYGPNPKMG